MFKGSPRSVGIDWIHMSAVDFSVLLFSENLFLKQELGPVCGLNWC